MNTAAPEGDAEHVVICDPDGMCVYANPREELQGQRLDSPDGDPWAAVGLPAGTGAALGESGSLARVLGQTREFVLAAGTGPGRRRRYRGIVRPLTLGDCTGLVLHLGTLRDDGGGRDRFAEQLRDGATVAAMVIDSENGRCLRATRGLARLLGTSVEQIVGRHAGTWFTRSGDFQRLMGELGRPRVAHTLEIPLRDCEGRHVVTLAAGEPAGGEGQQALLVTFADVSAYRRLVDFTNYDALTALPNRNQLRDRLELAMAAAARGEDGVAVMFLDLDGFKAINDEHGHAVGDLVLKFVADRLARSVRDYDLVARVGGDEFIVMLDRVAAAGQIDQVAANLRGVIGQPVTVDDLSFTLATSVGIGVYPDDGDSADALLRCADERMYADKRGRGAAAAPARR